VLLDKVPALHVFKIQFVDWITKGILILSNGVVLVTRNVDLRHDVLAIRTGFLLELQSLPQDAIPAEHVVTTLANRVVLDVFTTNRTLFYFFLGLRRFLLMGRLVLLVGLFSCLSI
jgi:hypothetical protein